MRKLAPCDVPNCVSCDESNLHYCLVCEADMLAVNGICQGSKMNNITINCPRAVH